MEAHMPFVEFFHINPHAFYLVMGVVGLLVGSFLNVVIYRLPRLMQAQWKKECCELLGIPVGDQGPGQPGLIWPASRCPHCGHRIRAWENIPLLSFLLLRGRCSDCRAAISRRYPLIEFLSALVTVVAAIRFGVGPQAMAAAVLSWALIALSAIDFEHKLLPDDITLPLLWCGILANMFGLFTNVYASLFGTILGYLLLWTVYHGFRLVTAKEGMGYGDFKLLAMLGAWTGWQMLPFIVICSSLVGAIVGVTLMIRSGHDRNVPIPFGPYLAVAGWVALLWGPALSDAYMQWAMTP